MVTVIRLAIYMAINRLLDSLKRRGESAIKIRESTGCDAINGNCHYRPLGHQTHPLHGYVIASVSFAINARSHFKAPILGFPFVGHCRLLRVVGIA